MNPFELALYLLAACVIGVVIGNGFRQELFGFLWKNSD